MRQILVHNNTRLLPSDHDLMKLPLDDVRLLQTQLQQELSKLSLVSYLNMVPQSDKYYPPMCIIIVSMQIEEKY